MLKKSKLWLVTPFIFLIILLQANSGFALSYNMEMEGLRFDSNPQLDKFTSIQKQTCKFFITDIQDVQEELSNTYSDESYEDGDQPADWGLNAGPNIILDESSARAYRSNIYKKPENITWTAMGTTEYSSSSKDSDTCILLQHNSLNSETRGEGNSPRIDKNIESSTIGALSFDVMTHLNISSAAENYVPLAKLHFELDDPYDTASTIHLVFQTEHSDITGYNNSVYLMKLNPSTGEKDLYYQVFTGVPEFFNWMHVEIFFDCYNDIYNITIGQYNQYLTDWITAPKTTIVRGNQYDPDTMELTSVGDRYAPSHLVSAVDFWIEMEKINEDNFDSTSRVYVDNLQLDTWKFPAVYSDVRLTNKDLSIEYPSGIDYMNDSIISCYEPPKYPKNDFDIYYCPEYLLNAENPGLLTPWILAPSWQYYIPMVVSMNHELNIRSILGILNSVEKPLEYQGVAQPRFGSMLDGDSTKQLNAQYFVFNSSLSYPYIYHFDAKYSDYYIEIEYFDDVSRAGLLKSITLGEVVNSGLLYTVFLNGFVSNSQIPGYDIPIFLGFAGVASIILKNKIKNRN